VGLARSCDGALGARMTGGGFGGSAIVLVRADHRDEIASRIVSGFAERFGQACGMFATRAAAGAGLIE